MSNAVLKGNASGTGTVTLETPNTNSDFTISLPAATGNMVVAGANSAIVSGTAVASTSGTSIDFTGIPSWVKRITVVFSDVSGSGTSSRLIQIGAGSVTNSGYVASASGGTSSVVTTTSTAGFVLENAAVAANTANLIATLINITGNTWVNASTSMTSSGGFRTSAGTVTLGGVLDRVRITTANGTDTFDAGTINILYE
jgi:hypothetical protein